MSTRHKLLTLWHKKAGKRSFRDSSGICKHAPVIRWSKREREIERAQREGWSRVSSTCVTVILAHSPGPLAPRKLSVHHRMLQTTRAINLSHNRIDICSTSFAKTLKQRPRCIIVTFVAKRRPSSLSSFNFVSIRLTKLPRNKLCAKRNPKENRLGIWI